MSSVIENGTSVNNYKDETDFIQNRLNSSEDLKSDDNLFDSVITEQPMKSIECNGSDRANLPINTKGDNLQQDCCCCTDCANMSTQDDLNCLLLCDLLCRSLGGALNGCCYLCVSCADAVCSVCGECGSACGDCCAVCGSA